MNEKSKVIIKEILETSEAINNLIMNLISQQEVVKERKLTSSDIDKYFISKRSGEECKLIWMDMKNFYVMFPYYASDGTRFESGEIDVFFDEFFDK